MPATRSSARSTRSHSRHSSITHASEPPGLLQTVQGHVGDIRQLIYCGVCVKPLYEPFTLGCGHTFCYSCLTQWFVSHRRKMTCPSCRAPVTHEPAPAYLIREIVQIFISRAELLEGDETTVEHMVSKRAESDKVEADKRNTHPSTGGLFEGCFKKAATLGRPIVDVEDGVNRCPYCAWELEDGMCLNCDGEFMDSDFDSEDADSAMMEDPGTASLDAATNTDTDSDASADYGSPPPYFLGPPIDLLNPPHLHAGTMRQPPTRHSAHLHSEGEDWGGRSSPITVDDSDEDDESHDSEMGSFIVDDTHEEGGSETDQATIVGDNNYMTDDYDYGIPVRISNSDTDDYDSRIPMVQFGDYDTDDSYDYEIQLSDYDTDPANSAEGEDDDDDDQPIRPPPGMAQRRQQTQRQSGQPYPQNSRRTQTSASRTATNRSGVDRNIVDITRNNDDNDDSEDGSPQPATRSRRPRGPRERRRPSQRRSRNRRNNAGAC